MATIALIGPDGAGKTTIGRQLECKLPIPVKYIYMGVNLEASNLMLPTSRWLAQLKRGLGGKPDNGGPLDQAEAHRRPRGFVKRTLKGIKSTILVGNRICDEWFRQMFAWYYQCQGNVVIFDRHYYSDYYAYDIANQSEHKRSWLRRLHGSMLEHVYPKPSLIIYLDAPSEVLLARKGEGTLEILEQRRQDYLQMESIVDHFIVVNCDRPVDLVTQEVADHIIDFCENK